MPESTSYRTFLQQFTQSHRQRSHLQLQAIQPWRSGVLVVSYIRGLRMFGLARGTVDQRVLACPTSRKTSSMSAIVWGRWVLEPGVRKRCHAPEGKLTIYNTPLTYYWEESDKLPFQTRERKREHRNENRDSTLGGGRRGCWLLRLFEVSGQGTQETKVTKDRPEKKKRNKRKHWGDNEEKRKMNGILKDKIKTKNNKV